ncbi:peroxiredoxin [Alishewanella sp. 16-MA]|uniref:Glutathione-dependent peroxiredoxin n=1 Tax=Alishewanella maricola TaxID=2795740 RepID=A0ABS8C1T6_9ALTE|nr:MULTISPECIES: peroxiredoxin [Gammaproteobacteria]MDP4944171.1 peroxiredoxin [Alishewanella sp.]MDP5206137.1 peroxiredoxin [Alishewanella sp. SMS9]MCB5226293.1 peroxiredoxin [Alishewanella maricola]MCF4008609.1 peroxiredoxin [Rheinheimera sp. UJ63]MDP5035651.1 peroxiredoxin [Alishewanella sp.]
MIKVGDKLPEVTFAQLTAEGMQSPTTSDVFAGKKVVLFAVPGAFTPTCSAAHLPGYIALADQIKAKGVDTIVCIAVNDAFVMKAWADSQNAEEITFLADGGASFHKAIGLTMETGDFGGVRSERYAMIVDDGVVSLLNVEPPKSFEVSKAETVLAAL